jgi:phosphoribosyl-ATP pyrophosphohydrolase
MPYTEMSYTINLTDEQFAILQNLVNEGMETILSPYDNINLNEDQEEQISKILSVVTFFNSHNILK